MQLNSFLTDDDAVSPVIGVLLMIAITAILAAVVASFALSFADSGGSGAPQVSFSSEYNDGENTVTVTVQSGDTFDAARVGFSGDTSPQPSSDIPGKGPDWADSSEFNAASTVSAGDSVTVGVTGPAYEIDIVFEADDGGESSIIRTLEGPDA